ncbi:MAG: hypothetical protein MPW17_15400 [Candidatus Manganitrophus sp.]|nr:hypothetical protein [Candidatus Manganitrophus sp.]WDT70137.1 MAG: hypothetical protein MPW17_15400 [Candidatus Manganitrophus sp.]
MASDGLFDVQPWAQRITDYFVKRSDLINPTMPNRLNVYFAGCRACASDAIINDIGFVAVERKTEDGRRHLGFELWVGGSLGAHPMLGFKLKEFLSPPMRWRPVRRSSPFTPSSATGTRRSRG